MNVSPWIRCPSCGAPIGFSSEKLASHFEGRRLKCVKCGSEHDWWAVACREIADNFMFNQAFTLVGAESSIFTLVLLPNQQLTFKLSDHGMPKDAKVLYINYTPSGGGLFPLEFHGNVPRRKHPSDEITIFPVPFGNKGEPQATEVSVLVSWISSSRDDESYQNLIDAFEAYSGEKYAAMVVPANVAVESALSRLLTPFLQLYVPKKRAEEFLDTAATYSHQLNVLVPVLTSLLKCPPLPDHLRGTLNRLRSLRNQLAHQGVLEQPLASTEAAELLCSALFGLHYVRMLQPLLARPNLPTPAQ